MILIKTQFGTPYDEKSVMDFKYHGTVLDLDAESWHFYSNHKIPETKLKNMNLFLMEFFENEYWEVAKKLKGEPYEPSFLIGFDEDGSCISCKYLQK